MSSGSSYSWRQELTLAITPKITASVSTPCNLFILYEILSCDFTNRNHAGTTTSASGGSRRSGDISTATANHNRGNWNAITRTILGMTVVDVLSSMAWFVSSWAVPEGTFALSAGNRVTCNVQGFFLQLAIGAPLYNCSLALYYLLVLKYRWTDQQLASVEKWVHLAVLSFATGSSILLLALDQYNPTGTVCWVMGDHDGDLDMENDWIYGIALFYGPLWICVVACVTSMIIIYRQVRDQMKRMLRYSIDAPSMDGSMHNTSGFSSIEPTSTPTGRLSRWRMPNSPSQNNSSMASQHNLGRSQNNSIKVAHEAMLYILSFLVTWMPSTIWSIARWFAFNNFYLDFAAGFCEPLQGLWNVYIFCRRRTSSKRKFRLFFHTIMPCWISFNEEDYMDPLARRRRIIANLHSKSPEEDPSKIDTFEMGPCPIVVQSASSTKEPDDIPPLNMETSANGYNGVQIDEDSVPEESLSIGQ